MSSFDEWDYTAAGEHFDTPEDLAEAKSLLAAKRAAAANGDDTPHPKAEASRVYDAVIADGGRQDDAFAASLDVLLAAATTGDSRVIIDRPEQ